MIVSIQKLRNFGIFENYACSQELKNFNQYNLIYGWNGSGKSTLSKVFECLAKKELISDFPSAHFEIKTADSTITPANLKDHNLDICVFNSNFVKENINWDTIVKSILLISQAKIEDKKSLKEKTAQLKIEASKLQQYVTQKNNLDEEKLKLLSQIARNVKQRFEILDSSDSHYVSYNRTKVVNRLSTLDEKIKSKELSLSQSAFEDTKKGASPKFKENISSFFTTIGAEIYNKAATRLNDLLGQTATSASIEFLKDNPSIQSWVEQGLEIHEHSETCYFCDAALDKKRLETLNNHFSKAFKELKDRLIAAETWLSQTKTPEQPQISGASFFEEYYQAIPDAVEKIQNTKLSIERHIQKWREVLNSKIENPFETSFSVEPIPAEIFVKYNNACQLINKQIGFHNQKSDNFKDQVDAAKKALEDHFLTEETHATGYFAVSLQADQAAEPIGAQQLLKQNLEKDIRALENSLNDEAIGAEKFNGLLHKFLGRNHIELRFDATEKGYKIIRKPDQKPAQNLSEGEKNAIGIVYFLTKLDENERDLKDCIVVMDDPASSFDSNNLFNTHSFLRSHCQQAKQLILLTHNFVYFKLARDWLGAKNKKDSIRSHFYHIEASIDAPRVSAIRNASNSLLEHNSEYSYVFECLIKHKETPELDIDQSFAIANMARKMLEAFLTFKFPSFRGDFNSLVAKAIKDETLRERIYRFINKYSHNQIIEFDSLGTDNVVYESRYIVRDILREIERLDKEHYDGMVLSVRQPA